MLEAILFALFTGEAGESSPPNRLLEPPPGGLSTLEFQQGQNGQFKCPGEQQSIQYKIQKANFVYSQHMQNIVEMQELFGLFKILLRRYKAGGISGGMVT